MGLLSKSRHFKVPCCKDGLISLFVLLYGDGKKGRKGQGLPTGLCIDTDGLVNVRSCVTGDSLSPDIKTDSSFLLCEGSRCRYCICFFVFATDYKRGI